jgi:hypothetical protein
MNQYSILKSEAVRELSTLQQLGFNCQFQNRTWLVSRANLDGVISNGPRDAEKRWQLTVDP